MAANSFGLFVQQLTVADSDLKVKLVQIIFDLLMVQDITTLMSKTMPVRPAIRPTRRSLRNRLIRSSSLSDTCSVKILPRCKLLRARGSPSSCWRE